MRPCPSDGLPVMGKLFPTSEIYVNYGHNCWGILWAPISGYSLAELMDSGTCNSIDMTPFHPNRFMNQKSNRGRKKGSISVGEQW
jgi:glycine/D-amino acid oxidase-like deaminating enzyme